MYELTINTDTFFLTSAFYYDKACEHPCPTIVPLVQGLAGTLRVHFVGELAPEAKDSCLFAIRPYRGANDLYRTEYVYGQTDEDGDVYFDIDLNVSTAELVGALTGREVLDVKAGFVVVNEDQSSRREFQSASTISKTVLAQNETAPLPKATAQSEADYYAAKYVSEWLYCGGMTTCVERIVATCTAPIKSNVENLCTAVVQMASEVYVCIGNTVQTIADNYATKAEVAGVEIKVNSNTSAIAEETSRATTAEENLSVAISTVDASVKENAEAIDILQKQQTTDEVAIQTNASNIAALQSSLTSYATIEALSEETQRASERENEIEAKIPDVSGFATMNCLGEVKSTLCNLGQTEAETRSCLKGTQTELSNLTESVQANTSSIAELKEQSATYVTLDGTQTIEGIKTITTRINIGTDGNKIQSCGSLANLCGSWRLNYKEIATKSDIPDVSDFVTSAKLDAEASARVQEDDIIKACVSANANAIDELRNQAGSYVTLCGAQTIGGEKTFTDKAYFGENAIFDKEIYVNSCRYKIGAVVCSGGYGYLCGTWKLNGTELATTGALCDLVTLGSEQTISGTKYITNRIAMGTTTEIQIVSPTASQASYANLGGSWRLNGSCIATTNTLSNFVTLDEEQMITGVKMFSTKIGIGTSTEYSIARCGNEVTLFGGNWTRCGSCLATKKDLPDMSCYVRVDCGQEIRGIKNFVGSLQKNGVEVATVKDIQNVDLSNYVTLNGDETISGYKTFSDGFGVGVNSSIQVDGAYARLYGNWTLGSKEIATKDDIPDASDYITRSVLTTGQFTVSGEWHFDGEVQMSNNNYTLDLQEGVIGGTWKMSGKTIATLNDIPDTSSFVTLSGGQTIAGCKTFSVMQKFADGFYVGPSNETMVRTCLSDDSAWLVGKWTLNGAEIATVDSIDASNFVTLADCQTIAARKRFSCMIAINPNDSTEIRITPGTTYANMQGGWRLNGSCIASVNNVVTLAGQQTITGDKYFSGAAEFNGMANFYNTVVISDKAYIGSCNFTMARNTGGDYVCLTGTWRLGGADLVTRDISDALDARITALEAKVG